MVSNKNRMFRYVRQGKDVIVIDLPFLRLIIKSYACYDLEYRVYDIRVVVG